MSLIRGAGAPAGGAAAADAAAAAAAGAGGSGARRGGGVAADVRGFAAAAGTDAFGTASFALMGCLDLTSPAAQFSMCHYNTIWCRDTVRVEPANWTTDI